MTLKERRFLVLEQLVQLHSVATLIHEHVKAAASSDDPKDVVEGIRTLTRVFAQDVYETADLLWTGGAKDLKNRLDYYAEEFRKFGSL